ncbi:MAG: DUF4363 family protein [Clostridium sp.]|nr:DUF4363 family protein [Clostridium sp.]
MKNIIITLCLFASMIFVCFISVNYLNKVCYKIYNENTCITTYIKNKNWEKAGECSKEMSDHWHSYSNVCSVFVSHTLIDDISLEEHKLESYIKTQDKDEALASSNSIEFLIERIKKLETINIQNLL